MNDAPSVKLGGPAPHEAKSLEKRATTRLNFDTVYEAFRRGGAAWPSASILNLIEQQKIRIGTCAWSFDEWSGVFYPADWPSNRWLEFYARYFPAVEIDSTFYSAPAEAVARRWVEMTPAHFRFACKLPREITHQRRLRDCRAELTAFLRALEPLAPKLRVVLIQLPPSYAPKEEKSAFRDFVAQLPADFRFAIEFRHPGWHRPHFIRLLAETSRLLGLVRHEPAQRTQPGALRVPADHDRFSLSSSARRRSDQIRRDGQRIHRYGKLLWKREAALDSWALRIQRHLDEIRSVWTFANNHYEGFSPETCQRLAQRLGFELPFPAAAARDVRLTNAASSISLPKRLPA